MRKDFERFSRGFLSELMACLGLALMSGCGPGPDPGTGGDTSTGNEHASTDGISTATDGTSTTTGMIDPSVTASSGASGGDPKSCDPPPPPAESEDPFYTQDYMCFPLPMELATCPHFNATVVREKLNPEQSCHHEQFEVQCGPDATPDEPGSCCYYTMHDNGLSCPGRPLTIDGEVRTAAATHRSDWSNADVPVLPALPPETRARLAGVWAAAAAAEHGSIASFARFVLQLLAVGAPAELVVAAQQAMADEIAHARACYAIAGAYAQRPIGPGRLDVSGAMGPTDLAAVAVAAVREGCINETLAALTAEIGSAHAEHPAIRSTLARIAADERRHARLAWQFVQWAVAQCPATASAVALAFAEAQRDPAPGTRDADDLIAHGLLSPGAQHELNVIALREVIAPAATALLRA
ncbi:ferritin-like domain-containing protein [Nannocystis sp. SCPEA4]|uniref:ferritin-like domain-containing protein n=1 Tax=Nannocystis sp. SCPEA4 TaxID=2996787 RepID=UPI00227065C6|nr:ferritin-like domain-containing protein [Nannocystis sp. SCPEA4]MCY1057678.1 ferritin-like domain-containing protein [Nannocystis sp. SCPEA4]